MSGVRLHKTLGINPKLGVCPLCKEDNGEIILAGAAVKDEYPRKMYGSVCDKCQKLLDDGNVGFLNIENMDSAVIKYGAVEQMFGEEAKKMKGKVVKTKETFWVLMKYD